MKKNTEFSEDLFSDPNYYQYIVQYQGEIEYEELKQQGYYISVINDKYAILLIPTSGQEIDIRSLGFESIVYIKPSEMYTLQQISPVEASKASFLQLNSPLSLTGNGVDIGIIDTGIDYLSEEFMKLNGETRVELIWDQTIMSSKEEVSIPVPYGSIYRKNEIDEAIKAYREGKSPYEIVPSKDENGHGTNMAGIIGGLGKNPDLKGMVPECNFVVVKLMQDRAFKSRFYTEVPIFNITSIFSALEFLREYALMSKKPMVILFPLGSNFGNHKGGGILNEFIEEISTNSGIAIVCGTGNQASNGTHTSGIIAQLGELALIELVVSSKQKDIWVEIWTEVPNVMSVDIISPSGENTGVIPAKINSTERYTFVFEKTSVRVNYYLPEESTGDELIRIRMYDLQPGIWRFRLTPRELLSGRYNAWIPAEGITVGGTKFNLTDPYGTITNPGDSDFIVTAAAYDQNNNNFLTFSGRAFIYDFETVDVAAGGLASLTVAPNNETAVITGTSVAAAVVAGACAMLFEWGIVQGNDPYIYSQTVKAYLAKGTFQREGDIYPNAQWGYGILDVFKMFQNMV
ncbi:S8 family peptidase [Clostridium sp. SHJSY1]|uniref:S8 family peptidase n=1 Tax=Clostridium sp. SHJSY1 TaxID=2942483 RepID=UPI002876848E|nr:S8 family peptidase [Clostridium sp. SHJSY1]MDS0528281.1 S8 family peptidase [Clostridium sp. SHJSY1]